MEEKKEVSLGIAMAISIASFLLALFFTLTKIGINASNFTVLFSHPAALSEFVAESVGASLALPALHVGVFSLFKSKRNSNTRRWIFIGWGVFLIALALFTALVVPRP